jgi:hypothetical protein
MKWLIIVCVISLVLLSGCATSKTSLKCGISANCDASRDYNPDKDILCKQYFEGFRITIKEVYYRNEGYCCASVIEPNWGKHSEICIIKNEVTGNSSPQ